MVFQIEFSLPSDRRRCPLQVLLLLPPPLLPLLQANVVFQIEFEVMPPPGSAPPSTTSAGTGPPGTGTGAAISTTAFSVPDSQALAAPIQQPVISRPLGSVSAEGTPPPT